MAGSSRAAIAVARADLFRGATVIVTPTERTAPRAVKRVTEFWEALGGRVVTWIPPPTTGPWPPSATCRTSWPTRWWTPWCGMDPRFFDVAARGFKDTTRIAASDPRVWREIFQENREALAEALAAFRRRWTTSSALIATGDAPRIEARARAHPAHPRGHGVIASASSRRARRAA